MSRWWDWYGFSVAPMPERPTFANRGVRWVRWWERALLWSRPMRVGAQEGYVIWYKQRGLGTAGRMVVYHATASPAGGRVRVGVSR